MIHSYIQTTKQKYHLTAVGDLKNINEIYIQTNYNDKQVFMNKINLQRLKINCAF